MKNTKRILLAIILLLLLVILLISFTYSKYAQTIQTGAKGRIARWNFSGNVESSTTNIISLSDTLDDDSDTIAPGSSGTFSIVVDATGSDVDIDYSVKYISEENKPENLFFVYGNDKTQKYYSMEDLMKAINRSNDVSTLSGTIKSTDATQKAVYDIYWEWPYETIDDAGTIFDYQDVVDGQNAKDYSFKVEITGIQNAN